jgi:hypothetical protein
VERQTQLREVSLASKYLRVKSSTRTKAKKKNPIGHLQEPDASLRAWDALVALALFATALFVTAFFAGLPGTCFSAFLRASASGVGLASERAAT